METPRVVSYKPTKNMTTNRTIAVGQASRLSPSSRKLETGWKPVLLCLALLSTLNSQLSTAFAQGSLTPPGLPAPTMKSADQIEPRTIVNAVNTPGNLPNAYSFVISQPGSYYLTTNLMFQQYGASAAIAIATNGVTLDLNGFTIPSIPGFTGPSSIGIMLASGVSDITIINGHINGGGNGIGITYLGNPPTNVLISKVSVSRVGVSGDGINVGTGNATVVENCTVTTAGGQGIVASIIKSSVATGCASNAIYGDTVSDCRGISSSTGVGSIRYGVYASFNAQNCYGSAGGSGIGLKAQCAINCIGTSTSDVGLFASMAQNCYGFSNSNIGLHAWIANGCSGTSYSGCGLEAISATSCLVGIGTTNITYHYNMPW